MRIVRPMNAEVLLQHLSLRSQPMRRVVRRLRGGRMSDKVKRGFATGNALCMYLTLILVCGCTSRDHGDSELSDDDTASAVTDETDCVAMLAGVSKNQEV